MPKNPFLDPSDPRYDPGPIASPEKQKLVEDFNDVQEQRADIVSDAGSEAQPALMDPTPFDAPLTEAQAEVHLNLANAMETGEISPVAPATVVHPETGLNVSAAATDAETGEKIFEPGQVVQSGAYGQEGQEVTLLETDVNPIVRPVTEEEAARYGGPPAGNVLAFPDEVDEIAVERGIIDEGETLPVREVYITPEAVNTAQQQSLNDRPGLRRRRKEGNLRRASIIGLSGRAQDRFVGERRVKATGAERGRGRGRPVKRGRS
jgi:hypothetical protein